MLRLQSEGHTQIQVSGWIGRERISRKAKVKRSVSKMEVSATLTGEGFSYAMQKGLDLTYRNCLIEPWETSREYVRYMCVAVKSAMQGFWNMPPGVENW
jgi:hypothetical protein